MFCDFANPVLHFFERVPHLEGGSAIGGTAIFHGGATFSRKYDGNIFQICFKVI